MRVKSRNLRSNMHRSVMIRLPLQLIGFPEFIPLLEIRWFLWFVSDINSPLHQRTDYRYFGIHTLTFNGLIL